MSKLMRIADMVINKPLMIMPEKLALIASVLDGRINIDASELKEMEVDAHLRDGPEASRFVGDAERVDPDNSRSRIKYHVSNGVAIIPVLGSLVSRGSWLGANNSGMTSYEGLAFQISDAGANPKINSIILDLDSPGGEAAGAFELSDKVHAVAKSKPVVAVVNGMAASAAYALAASATQIVTTPSGVSGSVGVVLLHADYTHAMHDKGVKPTFIFSGAHKVDGNPYEPLSESVKADFKADVDHYYNLFVSSVAAGRKGRMTEKSIRGTEARMFIGQAAVDAGLVDAIGSFESVLADLSRRGTVRNSNPKRMTMDKTFSQAEVDAAIATAVTQAKAEGAAALNAAKAEHDTALKAATGDGAKAERERIKGILASDEAKGREKAALHLAMTTALSVDETKGALLGVSKDAVAPGAGGPSHGLFLSEQPGVQKAEDAWGEIVAKVNSQNKPR